MLNRFFRRSEEKLDPAALDALRAIWEKYQHINVLYPGKSEDKIYFYAVSSDYDREPSLTPEVDANNFAADLQQLVGTNWLGQSTVHFSSLGYGGRNPHFEIIVQSSKAAYLSKLIEQVRLEEMLKLWAIYPDELSTAKREKISYDAREYIVITCSPTPEATERNMAFISALRGFIHRRIGHLQSDGTFRELDAGIAEGLFDLIKKTEVIYKNQLSKILNEALNRPLQGIKDLSDIVVDYVDPSLKNRR